MNTYTAIFLFVLLFGCNHSKGEKKEVSQAGQPTHFHMEDRGPEIQVTADGDGVKINAKPAGLNVVAKPGQVPSTVPEVSTASTATDPTGLGAKSRQNLQPVNTNPQLLQYSNEPVAYNNGRVNNAGVNGMAGREEFNSANTMGALNPNINQTPNQFESNGNVGQQLSMPSGSNSQGNVGVNGLAGGGINAANTMGASNPTINQTPNQQFGSNSNVEPQLAMPSSNGASSLLLQLPTDYVEYLKWKAGYQRDGDLDFIPTKYHAHHHAHHHHPHHHYGHHYHRHRMVNNFYFPSRHNDYDDDDYDYDDEDN